MMASPMATKRLTKEFKDLEQNPVPFIEAHPSESNILNWYFILTGPPKTPYEGGSYFGALTFHKNYPFEPPGIKVITPSGRFIPNQKICLSISDFHRESWNPSFSVGTILNGLLSFMTSEESTTGEMKSSIADRKLFAQKSHEFNKSNYLFNIEFAEYYSVSLDKKSTSTTVVSSPTKCDKITVTNETTTFKSKIGQLSMHFPKIISSNDEQLNGNVKRAISNTSVAEVDSGIVIDIEAEDQERKIREGMNKQTIYLVSDDDDDDFNFFEDEDGFGSDNDILGSDSEQEEQDVEEEEDKDQGNDDKLLRFNTMELNGCTEDDAIIID